MNLTRKYERAAMMMDTFTLAATSFTIALSLFIMGKKDTTHTSFALFCLAVFVAHAAIFLRSLFAPGFWGYVEHIGILAIAPLAVWFFLHLTHSKSYLTQGSVALTSIISAAGAFMHFSPLASWPDFRIALIAYACVVLTVCYFALLRHVVKMPPSTERRRLRYLLIACPVAVLISGADMLGYLIYDFPPVTGLVLSALLYLILLIVAYPQLSELHDFFARALVIFISTLTGVIIFYFVAFFFSANLPSFNSVVMASFLIVIAVTPVKMILKIIFSYFYPDSKDVFTSLYEFDEKLEREKAMLLSEMAPVIAHEIRNPLGSIKGAAQVLQSEAATEEHSKLLGVIIEETNRLNGVVSQFLDYARPHTGRIQTQDVNAIIRRAIAIISANRLTDRITIASELYDNLPAVPVDEEQILQVILNISLNAIEAMPEGGTLTFRTTKMETGVGDAVGISIRDTGGGVSPDDIKNIFKPFYTTKERGVGLGLAICQRIIKEHGGVIRVKSLPGQGSVFFIRLNAAGGN
jgi:signal transduction histidine kinase